MECELKAKQIVASENAPRKANGWKIGYMDVMKDLWEEKGYAELNLTRKNLSDQARKLEETMGDVGQNEPELGNENDLLGEVPLNIQNLASSNVNKDHDTANLNITTTNETEQKTVNAEVECLLSKASVVYASVIETPGEFQNRSIDTRIKQKPTKSDIKNVNITIDLLVKQHLSAAKYRSTLDVFWK